VSCFGAGQQASISADHRWSVLPNADHLDEPMIMQPAERLLEFGEVSG
jgi:hypothetical protein